MIYFVIVLFAIFFTLLNNSLLIVSEVNLLILLFIIFLDYYKRKSLSLFQIWQFAFIFIILSEIILSERVDDYFIKASEFLIIANYIVVLGYLIPAKKQVLKTEFILTHKDSNQLIPIIFILIIFFYASYQLPRNLMIFQYGRSIKYNSDFASNNLILNALFDSASLVLPAIIVFYFKEIRKSKSIIKPLIISLPIFIILFFGGTRFPLLFSFLGFILMASAGKKGQIRINLKVLIAVVLLVGSSSLMKTIRIGGFESNKTEIINKSEKRFSRLIASQMSPEGIIDMNALMMQHFDNNPHTLGKSSSFILYFWVPRSVWPEKPTMLGHWLIRKYRNVSMNHNASFGFTGDLYADFGFYSLLFVFIFGFGLRRLDHFMSHQMAQEGSYPKILAIMLFPYVFFFVRSPITSTMTFIGVYIIYYIMRRLMFSKFTK